MTKNHHHLIDVRDGAIAVCSPEPFTSAFWWLMLDKKVRPLKVEIKGEHADCKCERVTGPALWRLRVTYAREQMRGRLRNLALKLYYHPKARARSAIFPYKFWLQLAIIRARHGVFRIENFERKRDYYDREDALLELGWRYVIGYSRDESFLGWATYMDHPETRGLIILTCTEK